MAKVQSRTLGKRLDYAPIIFAHVTPDVSCLWFRVENIFNKERKTSSKTERKICNNTTDNQQDVQNRCRLDLQSGAVRSLVQEKLCILVTHRSHYHHQVAL